MGPGEEGSLDSGRDGSGHDVRREERNSESISRRKLIAGAAGAAGAAVLGEGLLGRISEAQDVSTGPTEEPNAVETTRRQGRPPSSLGSRSPHEQPRRPRNEIVSGTPHEELLGTITPSDLHYERHHGGVPEVDPAGYSLLVHGLVDRPTVFSLSDLKSFPSTSVIRFLECSGNFSQRAPEETPPSLVAPLTSNSEWTGAPLSILFREVGVRPEAKWFLAEGQDAAVMTRSIPLEKGWEDAMVAYGQNGEALRPEQGYPARLFLPGWEGNASVKWLRRIELSDRPFMTREETARYTDPIRGEKSRQFSFVMDARSLITEPAYPQTVEPGWIEIRGIAWSGRGRISRVELSLDDRMSWIEADLQAPVLPRAHTRFRYLWRWNGEETAIWSRAVDETGYVQPHQEDLIAARGTGTTYHLNPTTGWRIRADGSVVYRTQEWAE